MSGPFRDELATAHATIARLEAEIRELRTELAKPRPKVPWARPSLGMTFVIAFAVLGLVAGAIAVFVAPRLRTDRDREQRGIAIAPRDGIPPTVDRGETAKTTSPPLDTANPYPSAKVATKCNCSPGDPLCSCL